MRNLESASNACSVKIILKQPCRPTVLLNYSKDMEYNIYFFYHKRLCITPFKKRLRILEQSLIT
jgi:hypothetical protein